MQISSWRPAAACLRTATCPLLSAAADVIIEVASAANRMKRARIQFLKVLRAGRTRTDRGSWRVRVGNGCLSRGDAIGS
jgi:hypothetical protein